MPTAPAATTESTELQKSIFNAPPSSIPAKPVESSGLTSTKDIAGQAPQGTKRAREEEGQESEQDDAPMDEDDEGDAPMEASSDED